MGDKNPIRTLGDYSKPSPEGYRNTIKLPKGNNVVPLRSDTIRLVQNRCSFYGLREIMRLRLFQFFLHDQGSNWLERLPTGFISTWEDLTTRFLAQFFPPKWNAKLQNDILMFQQHQGVMECKVDMLMKNAISLMGRSEYVCGITSDIMRQLPPRPCCQEAFEDLVMNFILDQEEKVKQLEEYMSVIRSDFMQLSLEVLKKLKDEIRIKKNKFTKIKKIMRYPDIEDFNPLNGDKFSKALTEKASFHTPKFVSPKLLCVKYARTIFPSPPFVRESTFGFKPEVLQSFEVYTPPVTYPKEVEENIEILIEVEPLDHTKLEDLGLNTCSHDLFLGSREIINVEEPEP
nr:hypothetical protein [Tanacetum cinerariifolium]